MNRIKELYNPMAIILAGSRVSGKFSPQSDWDFYVLTNDNFEGGFHEFEGERLDVTPVPYPVSADFILDTKFHPEQHLKIVFDESNGIAGEIVKRTHIAYTNGPARISIAETSQWSKMMSSYIAKSIGRQELPGYVFYYMSIFYCMALRIWFQTRKEWPLPPYEALPHIKENDKIFYDLLEGVFAQPDSVSKIAAAKKIHTKLFGNK